MDRMSLRVASDVVTIVLGVVLIGVLVWRWVAPPPTPFQLDMQAAETSLEAVAVDFSENSRTLVMVLQSDCGFCQESMPFYRRLLERDHEDLGIVVAAPPSDRVIGDYLASEGVNPDSIVFVDLSELSVPGTPTLLLADDEGQVMRAWVGLLNAEREAELIATVFG